ncbi:MAG: type VI secretion system tip protein VgrG [Planctomycetaceae bacterium]|nr:type VI secretion system tip protein VgrG [Planctomycetaceae bacterium]
MSDISPDSRFAEFVSPLKDSLLFRRLSGREAVGELWSFRVDLLSPQAKIDQKKMLGQYCTVKFATADTSPRQIGGVVSRLVRVGPSERRDEEELFSYVAELRPWLWLLTRRVNCRIFENVSVVDVIETVLKDYTFAHIENRLTETYASREYITQYRESDADFLIRLMEDTGIYYFFEHAADHQTMVLCDSLSAHQAFPSYASVPFNENANDVTRAEETLTQWGVAYEVSSGAYAQTDYNFTTPAANLASNSSRTDQSWASALEVFDYPGIYDDATSGDALAKLRLESGQVEYQIYTGHGTSLGMAPGSLVSITNNPIDDDSQEYILTSVEHSISTNSYRAGDKGEDLYECRVTAIASDIPFRLKRRHPNARIEGPQTAVVVTDDQSAEIWTDQYGRIKVAFFWDRRTPDSARVSCWVRVSQGWAGKNWGHLRMPRVGQEVIVSFLEGNPDRPIVTGCVYNANQMPPDELPTNQTRTVFRTRSSPKGTTDNFHELTFEDKKGSEQIYFHSERDFVREVENDDSLKVGFDTMSPGNQSISIFNNRTLAVGDKKAADGSQTTTIFNNDSLTVGCEDAADGSQTVTVWNKRTVTVKNGDDTLNINTGDRKVTLGKGKESTTIDQGNRETTLTKGDDKLTLSAGSRTVTLDKGNYTLTATAGDVSVKASAGSITLNAMKGINLVCGGNSIKLSQSGIEINGMQVTVKASANLDLEGGAMLTAKGGATTTIKGALVQIN